MNLLLHSFRWDVRLQIRHHIVSVALAVTTLYCLLMGYMPVSTPYREEILTLVLLTDPSMLGFMFVGVLVLFEKEAGTLQALVITPMQPRHYIWAKVLSLTCIALPCSLLIAYVGHPSQMNPLFLILAVAYASVIFVLVGLIGVVRVQSLNQYLVMIPFCLIPLLPPIVTLFGVDGGWLLYLIPTQGILLLYEATWHAVSCLDLLYAMLYPPLCIIGLYCWTRSAFQQFLIQS